MGKLEQFTITLNSPNAVYHAGMPVEGHVTVQLNDGMKVRGIRLRFVGEANVHWTEEHSSGSGKDRTTTTYHYSANECYFDTTVVLFGKAKGQSGDNPILPAGLYNYPFVFHLPPNLPSSFEGGIGRVRYALRATIDKPWKFDHNCIMPFTVLSLLDLNVQPNVRESQCARAEKRLCCLCCQSEPIKAEMSTDRRGYVPGEYVTIHGSVENGSSRRMSSSKVSLLMRTVFHATNKSRSEQQNITDLRKGEIAGGGSEDWNGMRFHIPPLPPSALVFCNIIDIQYFLEMVVSPAGPAFDLELPLEIVIGTVPLQNVYSTFSAEPPPLPPLPGALYEASSDVATCQPAAMPEQGAAPSAPPPTYAECVLGKVNLKEEENNEYVRGQVDYAPTYAYYNWDQPPS